MQVDCKIVVVDRHAMIFDTFMMSRHRSPVQTTPWRHVLVAMAFLARSSSLLSRCGTFARVRTPMCARVHTEARMAKLGIVLPDFQEATLNYVKAQWDGDNKLYLTTHFGQTDEGVTVPGKVGDSEDADVSPAEAKKLARNAGLRLLSTLSHYLGGDLDRVEQVVQLTGIVNGVPSFSGHGGVVDGCSDVLVEALEDRGRHSRVCTGAGSLGAAVTCDMIVRVHPAGAKE